MKKLFFVGVALAMVLAMVPVRTVGAATPADLVGLWHFDGNADDSSGYNNHGTLMNGAAYDVGQFGQALKLDGVDDYVNCGAAVNNTIATEVTLEAWIYPIGKQRGGIISNDLTYGTKKGYDFFLWDGYGTYGSLFIDYGNGAALGRAHWSIPSADWYGQWHHVAATWDGITIRLYADSAEVASVSYGGAYHDPGKATLIGGINYSTLPYSPFTRLIDEVRIWSRALSAEEIAYNYSLRDVAIDIKPGSEPNCINLGANGVIPVAILTTETFDAADVDPFSVNLDGAEVRVKGKSGNAGALQDVDGDGDLDLVVQVDNETNLLTGATQATLTAETYGGLPLVGTDTICIVPPE